MRQYKVMPIEPLTRSRLCWFISGGIVAKINRSETVGHLFGIVEAKKPDCSATACGTAFETTTIEANMALPSLLTGMKEEDVGFRDVGSTEARSEALKRFP